MPLFGKSQKSPVEIIKALKENIILLEKGDKKVDKASEEIAKYLLAAKNILIASSSSTDTDCNVENISQLTQEILGHDIIILLLHNLSKLDFESKKDVVQILTNLLRLRTATRCPTVEYICSRPEILFTLLAGYNTHDIALSCGTMLRECLRHESLTRLLLLSSHFYNFFTFIELPSFDVASDAFASFKDAITRHKLLCAEFMQNNYDSFFSAFENLLVSSNYVTRRQSLKLLAELLLDRNNFSIMTKYISSTENLKLIMNMLKDKSKSIQFEAFHVFKVFVANPNKTKPIIEILLRNKEKMMHFLSDFQTDRCEDEQFNDEKSYLIKQIKELK